MKIIIELYCDVLRARGLNITRAVKYRLSFNMAEWCNSNTTFREIVENGAIPFPAPILCSVLSDRVFVISNEKFKMEVFQMNESKANENLNNKEIASVVVDVATGAITNMCEKPTPLGVGWIAQKIKIMCM